MSHVTNKLYVNNHRDILCLAFPDVRNALHNIHKDFVIVPIDKTVINVALVCKRF